MLRILLATTVIYFLPRFFKLPEGIEFFMFMSTWSLIFIAYLETLQSNTATALIGVESLSILINFIAMSIYLAALILHMPALKTAYIYVNRPHIITACFVAELLIIGGRIAYVAGVDAYLHNVRDAYRHVVASTRIRVPIRSESH